MPNYEDLQQRLDDGEVVILDGAIGTELQRMGAPMDYHCWAALANETHPASVRQLHEDYIRAGVDVITTNTYMSARHVIQHGGFEDRTRDWNKRSVELALEARERTPSDRPVYVAGSVSVMGSGAEYAPAEVEESCREQIGLLVEAGVDLLLLEMLATSVDRVQASIRFASEADMPAWLSLTCMIEDGSAEVMYGDREAFSQRAARVDDITFEGAVAKISEVKGPTALLVFHSQVESTGPGLQATKSGWSGTTGAYANSGYWVRPNWQYIEMISPADYLRYAREWVGLGAQIIGGCCGVGLQHVELLREGLPDSIHTTASAPA